MVAKKAVDLRMDQKSFSATSTAAIRTIQPIFAQRKREHSNGWKRRKKAKLVSHTAWSGPSALPFPPAPTLYNPTFQPTPAFTYNPYPNNWPPRPPTYPKPLSLPPPSSQQQAQEVHHRQAHPQSKSLKAPKLPKQLHCHPSA